MGDPPRHVSLKETEKTETESNAHHMISPMSTMKYTIKTLDLFRFAIFPPVEREKNVRQQ